MRNRLLPSAVLVGLVWWTVFTAWYFFHAHPENPASWAAIRAAFVGIGPSAMLSLLGALAGAIITLLSVLLYRRIVGYWLRGRELRGFTTTIGIVPPGLGVPARRKGATIEFQKSDPLGEWVESLEQHPAHKAVYEALVATFAASSNAPAAPVKSGHGGLDLFEHSCNVAREMVREAPEFRYEPEQDARGRARHPLKDPMYEFNGNDPLIGLAGLAHDLGKIECYVEDEHGNIVETRRDHDRVGSLMLSRMPEVWKLPAADRLDLLAATGHYHHPQDLPDTTSDRGRALMEYLIECDQSASAAEGRDLNQPLSDEPSESEIASVLIDTTIELLADPHRLNGTNAPLRIGYKHGGLLYLSEPMLRLALAERLGYAASVAEHRMGDGRYTLTVKLMQALQQRGLLYDSHDGHEYTFARAYWNVRFLLVNDRDTSKSRPIDNKAMILVKITGPFEYFAKLPDSRGIPSKIEPMWSTQSAVNKAAAKGMSVIEGGQSGQVADLELEEAGIEDIAEAFAEGMTADVVPEPTEEEAAAMAILEAHPPTDSEPSNVTELRPEDAPAVDSVIEVEAEPATVAESPDQLAIERTLNRLQGGVRKGLLRMAEIKGEAEVPDVVVYLDDRATALIGEDGVALLVANAENLTRGNVPVQESSKEPGVWLVRLANPSYQN